MSLIIYPQENGKLSVLMPCGEVADSLKHVPAGVPYAIVDDLSHVDDEYFDGYIYFDGKAIADIERCKTIHRDKFRAARKPLLESLDVQYMKALEIGNAIQASEIAAKKQELRDITKIPLPENLSEIKLTWPEILS